MAQGRRHHYIPQFLLRRFASSKNGKTTLLWQYGFGRVIQSSTRDVAVAKDFHGGPETDLETRLSVLEGKQAELLRRIDADGSKELELSKAELAHFFVMVDMRTRALRDGLRSEVGGLLDAVDSYGPSEEGTAQLAAAVTPEFVRKTVLEGLAKQGALKPEAEGQVEALMQHPQLMDWVRSQLTSPEARATIDQLLGGMRAQLDEEDLIKTTHQGVIGKLVASEDVSRYANARWSLLRTDAPTFVLGDSSVVVVGTNGQLGLTAKFKAEDTHEVYLPIGPTCVVMAAFHDSGPSLSNDDIVDASVSLSRSAFFADRKTDELQALAETIGTAEPLLDATADEMIRESWGKLDLE